MSKSLLCASRSDLSVEERVIDDVDQDVLQLLWNALRTSSVDVALNPATSTWGWLDSCRLAFYVYRLMIPEGDSLKKLGSGGSTEGTAEDKKGVGEGRLEGDEIKYFWSNVETNCGAPINPSSQEFGGKIGGDNYLEIEADFRRRIITLQVGELGTLQWHSHLLLNHNREVKPCHAYLFFNDILFVEEVDYSVPGNAPSRLRIVGVIAMSHIEGAGHVLVHIDNFDLYGIELKVRLDNYDYDKITLVIPNARELVIWSDALAGCRKDFAYQDAFRSAARGLTTLTNWSGTSTPFLDYNVLQDYTVITIPTPNGYGECGVYRFQDRLVFIGMTPGGTRKILRDIGISEIQKVFIQGAVVTLLLQGERPQPWFAKVTFQSAALKMWSSFTSKKGPPPGEDAPRSSVLLAKPVSQAWFTAGIVTLTDSTDGENEFNLCVAINPYHANGGIATHAVAFALNYAFEKLDAHRVVARVLHGNSRDTMVQGVVNRFIHWGFTHEGVRRQGAVNPDGSTADMSVLAMLDTDWAVRETVDPPSTWDELFRRHKREREALQMAQVGNRTGDSYTLPGSSAASDAGTWSSWTAVSNAQGDTLSEERIRLWIERQVPAGGGATAKASRGFHSQDFDMDEN